MADRSDRTFNGRWSVPDISKRTGELVTYTLEPLTLEQVAFGLRSVLSASSLGRLQLLVMDENELYDQYLKAVEAAEADDE